MNLPATPHCCIAYTTDMTYLFPTLVSAMQARRFSSTGKADVMIFCVGLDRRTEAIFAPICDREDIHLVGIESGLIEGQTAMLARLFLDRMVPAQYTQYLYLDGDVQIRASLDPLLDVDVPAGRFLAANDPMTFLLEDKGAQSRDLLRHLESIGLSRVQSLAYFNSGVLRINREGWDEIGMRAWNYSRQHGGPSRFPDQDALNIVAFENRLPMSLAWNFPIFMRNARVERAIQPRITHFMSSPKPWHASFPPWTSEAYKPYVDALATYPALAEFSLDMPLLRKAVYHLQQRGKRVMETVLWGYSERRGRILNYEAACSLPMTAAGH
jgi:hypothetical protein